MPDVRACEWATTAIIVALLTFAYSLPAYASSLGNVGPIYGHRVLGSTSGSGPTVNVTFSDVPSFNVARDAEAGFNETVHNAFETFGNASGQAIPSYNVSFINDSKNLNVTAEVDLTDLKNVPFANYSYRAAQASRHLMTAPEQAYVVRILNFTFVYLLALKDLYPDYRRVFGESPQVELFSQNIGAALAVIGELGTSDRAFIVYAVNMVKAIELTFYGAEGGFGANVADFVSRASASATITAFYNALDGVLPVTRTLNDALATCLDFLSAQTAQARIDAVMPRSVP